MVQRILILPVLRLVKVPENPGIQLFCRKRRLQIDRKCDVSFFKPLRNIAAGAEKHRTRNAEMGEQHLPEIPVQFLFSIPYDDLHIPERKPLQVLNHCLFRGKRNQGRACPGHAVARLFCKAVPVSG